MSVLVIVTDTTTMSTALHSPHRIFVMPKSFKGISRPPPHSIALNHAVRGTLGLAACL